MSKAKGSSKKLGGSGDENSMFPVAALQSREEKDLAQQFYKIVFEPDMSKGGKGNENIKKASAFLYENKASDSCYINKPYKVSKGTGFSSIEPDFDQPALHNAIESGDPRKVKLLLQFGASPLTKNGDDLSAFQVFTVHFGKGLPVNQSTKEIFIELLARSQGNLDERFNCQLGGAQHKLVEKITEKLGDKAESYIKECTEAGKEIFEIQEQSRMLKSEAKKAGEESRLIYESEKSRAEEKTPPKSPRRKSIFGTLGSAMGLAVSSLLKTPKKNDKDFTTDDVSGIVMQQNPLLNSTSTTSSESPSVVSPARQAWGVGGSEPVPSKNALERPEEKSPPPASEKLPTKVERESILVPSSENSPRSSQIAKPATPSTSNTVSKPASKVPGYVSPFPIPKSPFAKPEQAAEPLVGAGSATPENKGLTPPSPKRKSSIPGESAIPAAGEGQGVGSQKGKGLEHD